MKIFNVNKSSVLSLALAVSAAVSGIQMSNEVVAQTTQARPPTIESVIIWGRSTRMLGEADSGSQGIVGNADFSTRPMMRVGELVEVIPGMIATQHSGSGKANQYFLRGMNLDHGSDFTAIYEGMPVNHRSHAHASGYLDINFMIPEIIEQVEFHKGTYYTENGDFSAAGASRFSTYERLDRNFMELTFGNLSHRRIVGAASFDAFDGTMLYAGEVENRDGPWELEEDVNKYNGLIQYTGNIGDIDSKILFMAYDNSWNSTDQIPLREVQNGNLNRFGFIDGSLGGESSRYSLIGNFYLDNIDINAYYQQYKMNLFGNPTYFLNDPVNGDQIEQADDRSILGGSVKYSNDFTWGRKPVTPMIGIDYRFDDIDQVALFNTVARQRVNTVRDDAVEERSVSVYGEVEVVWTESFRTKFGLRQEFYDWDVQAQIAANSGSGNDSITLPKFTAAWIPFDGYEIYLNYGEGFHSNDVRGAEITIDPATLTPADPVDVLVRAEGYEIGLRGEPLENLNFSAVAFWMDLESELLFVGDAGTSEPNDPTTRRGIELATFWEVTDSIVIDANVTKNHSRFANLPTGANHIPDAHGITASAGITYVNPGNGLTASFRMRHFGDAPLEATDSIKKDATTIYNFGISYAMQNNIEIGLDILNIFDTDGDDIEFWFESQLQGEAAPVDDFHFHPVEPRAYRLNIKYSF
ncbi:TonB-dependent receptor [Haliea sp. AH-315-K21]|nr:TonB-dependent receptor [Haliea sp. AH-315-K21]MBN4075614.1 TonB-dependent receptor [Gammaproteobacteria bacterium AH-315-E17]